MADNTNTSVETERKCEDVEKVTQFGWGYVPECSANFIEVKDIEIPSNVNINYKVSFKADVVIKFKALSNLIDKEQLDNTKIDTYFINYTKNGFYKIPFYAVVQKDSKFKLLKVKIIDINSTNVSNYTVEIIDDTKPESSGRYPTQKLYVSKTDIESLKTDIKTTEGGRKSRRTINRKRRAVRKRRNTKRHSKTYRR
jgi:heterodisulfide reductase subunit A-like polyferredoxin